MLFSLNLMTLPMLVNIQQRTSHPLLIDFIPKTGMRLGQPPVYSLLSLAPSETKQVDG